MSNLTEQAIWHSNVNKIDDQEFITEDLLNAAPQYLADRTQYLKIHRHDGIQTPKDFAVATMNDPENPNAISVNLTPALTANIEGLPIHFLLTQNITSTTPTLNVNGLGAVTMNLGGSSGSPDPIQLGNLRAYRIYTVVYQSHSGQSFILQNPSPPVGLLRWHIASGTISGHLSMDGTLVSRSTYALLWQWAQNEGIVVSDAAWNTGYTGLFSSGNGSTTFRLPQTRGEFPRFFDGGRGVDAGRSFGVQQKGSAICIDVGFNAMFQQSCGTVGDDAYKTPAWRNEQLGLWGIDPPGTVFDDASNKRIVGDNVSNLEYVNHEGNIDLATGTTNTRAFLGQARPRNITFTLHIKY